MLITCSEALLQQLHHSHTRLSRLFRTADDYRSDDGITMSPAEVYAYLTRVMYNRRNKFDPLWNSLVVGGLNPPAPAAAAAGGPAAGAPFLGMVGMIGTHYTDSHVTTGARAAAAAAAAIVGIVSARVLHVQMVEMPRRCAKPAGCAAACAGLVAPRLLSPACCAAKLLPAAVCTPPRPNCRKLSHLHFSGPAFACTPKLDMFAPSTMRHHS